MTTPNLWIRSQTYDLLFFSTFWWVPLFLLLFVGTAGRIAGILFILYHLFLRIPHFVATARVTYLNPDHKIYYREHWFRYFAIPVLILTIYGVLEFQKTQYPQFHQFLSSLAIVWGLQHISFQNYGILSIYRGRLKSPPDLWGTRLEKSIFYLLFFVAAFEGTIRTWIDGPNLNRFIAQINHGLKALLLLTTLTYLARILKSRRTRPISWPGLLFLGSAMLSLIYWPFYNHLGPPGSGGMLFFYIFNGHHCICYLGLLFLMDSNQKSIQSPHKNKKNNTSGYLRYFTPLALVATVLIGFAYMTSPRDWDTLVTRGDLGVLGALQGFFVVHYYIESLSWKFKNPHYQKTILPLLRATTFNAR